MTRITPDEARRYFADPSQQVLDVTPDTLPEEWCEYWADGPVCIVFHATAAENVWMAHLAVLPEARGHLVEPALRVLRAFWAHHNPRRIVAWIEETRRPAIAFARRLGAREHGRIPGTVMMDWSL